MALSKSTLKKLAGVDGEGWSCNDSRFPSDLCDCDDHNSPHNMIESGRKIKFSGNAAKLHIGEVFVPDKESDSVFSLFSGTQGMFNSRTDPNPEERSPPREGVIQIPPGSFVFFLTEERINLPFDICGQLFMNPQIANSGLLFFTTGHIAPGWMGRLTGTLLNMTDRTVYLNRTDHVLYLTFLNTQNYPDISTENTYSTHGSHKDPQLTIEDARSGELAHPGPGFARTTEFVTKQDLYEIVVISLTALTILVTILVTLLPS